MKPAIEDRLNAGFDLLDSLTSGQGRQLVPGELLGLPWTVLSVPSPFPSNSGLFLSPSLASQFSSLSVAAQHFTAVLLLISHAPVRKI